MRVLHVAQPAGGGVPHAVSRYAQTTAGEVEHHLLGDPDVDVDREVFASVIPLPAGTPARVRAVHAATERVGADVVHAHSSFAGGYARLASLSAPVVYQPHCFVFDDPGRARWKREAFRAAEAVMARRTAVTVALTPHEAALARGLHARGRIMQVPNVPDVETVTRHLDENPDGAPLRVVMVGRISAQKDPAWFAAVSRRLAHAAPGRAVLEWIGDGEPERRRLLEEAGVRVRGWVRPEGVKEALDEADLYLHSASYEGFPLSVLQAWARDVPVLIRSSSWTEGLGLCTVDSPEAAAEAVISAAADPDRPQRLQEAGREQREKWTEAEQRKALLEVYAHALAGRRIG
ncbi:glycosyltransferase family 4 protein [Micrococcus sp.]|uniref:glycosyltransferase family 4 protein n=1 Tax=Micrococcus sp. TaxID=1271 RepID=UPI002A90D95A|nr:glycosyltransferase family 4 protein [Micrococcus sp.]MDY6056159.1 glycosyltransferase family 4 protein [Micrococcus sp.]